MTTTDVRPAAADADAPRHIVNFGKSLSSVSSRADVRTVDDWERTVRAAGRRGLTARGAGLSYSDAALNSGGTLVSAHGPAVGEIDVWNGPDGAPRAFVDVGAAVPLREILRAIVPQGWTLPVLPGTALVTVGGAIAADVHGKNHAGTGSFGSHVSELVLLAPGAGALVLRPDDEAFWATVGGLGLTGVILSARLELEPITTSRMAVEDTVCGSLDAVLTRMLTIRPAGAHVLAWIDGHARGHALGRGVVTSATPATEADLSAADRRDPLRLRTVRAPRFLAPAAQPGAPECREDAQRRPVRVGLQPGLDG